MGLQKRSVRQPASVIEFNPNYVPNSSISFTDVTEYTPNFGGVQASANQGGIVSAIANKITIDSQSVLGAGGFVPGENGNPTSYLLLNYIDKTGLDVQNSGSLASLDGGDIVIGGSSFENQGSGTLTVGGGSTTFLGYNETSVLDTFANTNLITTTNSGLITVYGTLYSNGSINNQNTFNVEDTGTDTADSGQVEWTSANVTIGAGNFINSGNLSILGSSFSTIVGNVNNTGNISVQDDLSIPQIFSTPLGASLSIGGDFNATSGTVTVVGGAVTVTGTLTNGGQFTIGDDTSGGASAGNSWPVQYSSFSAGTLVNSGIFTSTETALVIGSGGLNNSGTFKALADDTLASPAGRASQLRTDSSRTLESSISPEGRFR